MRSTRGRGSPSPSGPPGALPKKSRLPRKFQALTGARRRGVWLGCLKSGQPCWPLDRARAAGQRTLGPSRGLRAVTRLIMLRQEASMPDIMTRQQRSERMSRVRNKDAKPEIRVLSLLHRLGFRFRLHVPGLPGKPDIVLPRLRKIVLVHGCYWHRHGVCRPLKIPSNNPEFWRCKSAQNRRLDAKNIRLLTKLGWEVLAIPPRSVCGASGLRTAPCT